MSALQLYGAANRRCGKVHRLRPLLKSSIAAKRVQARVAMPDAPTETSLYTDPTQPKGCQTVDVSFGDRYFTAEDSRPIILFDGVCNLCNTGVNFVLDFDPDGAYRFAALQSEAGKALLQRSGRAAEDISSIVLVTPDKHWIKSEAVVKIAEKLKMPLPVFSAFSRLFVPALRDVMYDWISTNRYKLFGETAQCRLMRPEWRDRFIV
eukprot:TRINITY_DN4678_c0_g2_i3.p2 TRINITY_DN4678_c0_g2~~TRINITY_DN4678_c0_g2_i3.p2  ORF type:complete len:207 (+),score=17.54 TRINITY_DN4678_c0_g2_i3:248-868(+)